MPTIGSLFAGIGGLDLGFELAGFETRWQVELDPYARAVLERHWPDVRRHGDVRTWPTPDAEPVDVIVGGFPCQPVSLAGKGLAQADPRWLWPEFRRVVAWLRPAWVVVENVPGLRRRGLRGVLADLAALGFDAEWTVLSAADVGAPHLRKRIFIAAWDRARLQPRGEPGWLVADTHGARLAQREGERKDSCAQLTPAQRGGSAGPVADSNGGGLKGIWRAQRDLTQAGLENSLRDLALGHGARDGDAQSSLGVLADGLPLWLARHGGLSGEESQRVSEALCGMWDAHAAQAIRESARVLGSMEAAQVLLAFVRQYEGDGGLRRDVLEGQEASRELLRVVRERCALASASHGRGSSKQLEAEHSDALLVLSRLVAPRGATPWSVTGWEGGEPRVLHGTPARVDRLRCLGNAVVPQVATVIARAIRTAWEW